MKSVLFAAVVAAQSSFLLGWAGWHEYVRQTAPVICLETQPVDPRDLLRGDYMILSYKISRSGDLAKAPLTPGQEVWAVLELRGEHYALAAVQLNEPAQLAQGQVAVRARATERGLLNYGIETYFVPEGKGTPASRDIEVEASVGADHRLQIKRVLVDGQPYP